MRRFLTSLALAASLLSAATDAQTIEVDLELALMVDVSRSMTAAELEIQRRGYAEALRSDEVFAAIQTGALQAIALTYIEWAGDQRVVVDWRVVQSREDLEEVATQLTAKFDPSLRRTGIAGAIGHATRSINSNLFNGWRKVIDISGDGPNNIGDTVTQARDAAVAQGIVINGLPLMTRHSDGDWGQFFHVEDLDAYYISCVIGGPGAFALQVYDWRDFPAAIKRKLVLEIAARPAPQIIKAQHRFMPDQDCLIGEKIWEQRRRMFEGDF